MNIEEYRLKKKAGIALRRFIFTDFACRHHVRYFGCDRDYMRTFIEYQFESWMGWDNFAKEWQIDHIVPICAFNLLEESEMVLCWNWINFRPLSILENKARNAYEYSVKIFEWRKKHFPENAVINKLLARAQILAHNDEESFVDWSQFMRIQ